MKRLLRTGWIVLVIGTLIIASRSWSDTKPGQGAHSKIALINLTKVLKGYKKVAAYQEDTKKMLQPYEEKARTIQQRIEARQLELKNKELVADKREKLEEELKRDQRQMEDISNEAKKTFGKKQEEQMVIIYKEVWELTRKSGKAGGYEVVMHYNDFNVDAPEYFSAMNIGRKLQAGACIPMYVAPGVDITDEIVAALNLQYRGGKDED